MDETEAPGTIAPTGEAVGLLGFGLSVDPVFDSILLSLPVLFGVCLVFLSGPKWRADIRRWLYGGVWSRAYAGLLEGLLARLDRFFGPPLGWRALDRCFALAVIYAVAFLAVQGLRLDLSAAASLHRAWEGAFVLTILATTSVAALLSVRRLSGWRATGGGGEEAASASAWRLRDLAQHAGVVMGITVVAVIVVAVVAIFAGDFPSAGAGVAAAFVGAYAGAVLGAGAPAGAAGAVIVIAISLAAAPGTAVGLAVLFLAIPAVNALFDWPSWWASRWLMERLACDASRPRVVARALAIGGHVVADLSLGALCLFGLAIAVAALVHALGVPEIWMIYRAAQDEPFSGVGAVMTAMLASTLVPTAIHLGFAVFALAVVRPPYASRVAFLAQEDGHGGRGEEKGTQFVVALYLTACAGFAMLTLWVAGRLALMALDAVSPDHAFWRSIFLAADCVVGAPCGL